MQNKSRPVYELVQSDVCLPDYWRGHSLPHISVPVSGDTKMHQLREALRREVKEGAVAGTVYEARLLSADMVAPSEEKHADRLTRAAYAAINRLKMVKGARKPYPNLDPEDTGDNARDSLYAYFVFVELEK